MSFKTISVKCFSDQNKTSLPSALVQAQHLLQVSGFNLQELRLPFDQPSELLFLNMNDNSIQVIPDETFIRTTQLRWLNLSRNRIEYISSRAFHPLIWLKELDLSLNHITSVDMDAFNYLRLLKTLFLDYNNIKALSPVTLESLQTLDNLTLYYNPWSCECDDSFKHWIREHVYMLPHASDIRCNDTGQSVMLSNVTCSEVSSHVAMIQRTKTQMIVASSLAAVFVGCFIISLLIYKHRLFLMVFIYTYLPRPSCCSRNTATSDRDNGIFAIYDDQDRKACLWVKDELIPHVEPARSIICYDRDFLGGMDMMDNIEDAIAATSCAVVFLTEHVLNNNWTRTMFQAAFTAKMEGRQQNPYKIITILADQVRIKDITSDENCPADLRLLLKTQHSLSVSQKLFWESLLYMLPHKGMQRAEGKEHAHSQSDHITDPEEYQSSKKTATLSVLNG